MTVRDEFHERECASLRRRRFRRARPACDCVCPLLRSLAGFALEVIGCNAGAYTLRDAVIALRVAVGDDGVDDRWLVPVCDEDLLRLRRAVRSRSWEASGVRSRHELEAG